jgi:hypothetical protein
MFWASIRRSSIAAIIFCLVFGVALALAQSGTTSLRGTVLDNKLLLPSVVAVCSGLCYS